MSKQFSDEYNSFKAATEQLIKTLLPSKFSGTGSYRNAVHHRARGFAVLFCAEVEHYVERHAEIVVERAFRAWRDRSIASKPLVSLVGRIAPIAYNGDGTGNATTTTVIGRCVAKYKERLSDNNGVKIANMENILRPIGIEVNELDQIWLSTLDSFARDRGNYAHATGIRVKIDPKEKKDAARMIGNGLQEIDQKFLECLEGI